MLYTIYQVTHKESGKTYIGKHQTLDPNDGYLGSGKMIRRAAKKHGLSAFKKEVLHVFETESEMNAKEAELVTEEFCARDDTYNLCPGGQGGWGYINSAGLRGSGTLGMTWSDETKERMSAAQKLRPITWRDKIAVSKRGKPSWNKGKQLSESDRANKSAAHTGSKNSQFGSKWAFNAEHGLNAKFKDSELPDGWAWGRKTFK